MPSRSMLRSIGRDRDSTPPVSTLRAPRFKGPPKPPSQQTPPSAQRPPNWHSQQSVVPSSVQPQQQSQPDVPEDADPIEDFSEYELPAPTPRTSQNAFQKMASSQASASAQRQGGRNPTWSPKEDEILMKGIRKGWSAFEIARQLEQECKNPIQRTDSAIRGRKKALIQKYNLQAPAPAGPTRLRVEKRQRWTPAEMSALQKGIREGLDAVTLHQEKFPYRSLRSVEHKVRKRKLLSKDPIVPRRKTPKTTWTPINQHDAQEDDDDDDTPISTGNDASNETPDETLGDAPNDALDDNAVQVDEIQQNADNDTLQDDGILPDATPENDAANDTTYEILDDDFDITTVTTAFVALPAEPSGRPGRLRSVKKTAPTPKPAETQETQADPEPTVVEETQPEPEVPEAGPSAVPADQRRGMFFDWDQETRWQNVLYLNGGDERAARRHLQDVNLTTRMFDAILYKNYPMIDNLKAEREQTELRWAIEDGRARRRNPVEGAAEIPNIEDVDDEVLRVEDWEIFQELEEEGNPMDYMSEQDSDDGIISEEEDMIRDREIEEVEDEEDEEDEVPPNEDVIHDREFEEIDDEEEEEAPPIVDSNRTPVQTMRAMVVDDGLPTPTATNEKLTAFGISSMPPPSSFADVAPSDITMTSTRDSELSTKSKRQRRRYRNAGKRRSSGSVRNKNAGDRRSMKTMSEAAAPAGAVASAAQNVFSSSPYGREEDNPFMDIVRNAHIPSPPRRRAHSPRRRGTPSPPAWFASNEDEEDDGDSSSEESE